MAKKPLTAEELRHELERDPAYRARRAEQEKQLASLDAVYSDDERGLVAEIRACGYVVDSVWDLVTNSPHPHLQRAFVGPYRKAYLILAKHLTMAHHRRVHEGIMRALTVKDGGRVIESSLLNEFRLESDPELRWVLANALKTAMPYHRRRKHPEIAEIFKAGVQRAAPNKPVQPTRAA
jgi:hypothetical protein